MKKIALIVLLGMIFFSPAKATVVITDDTIIVSGAYPEISWKTQKEINIRHFKVLRSYDSLTWSEVRRINAIRTSGSSAYSVTDSGFVRTGALVYYQICCTDITAMESCFAPMNYSFSTRAFTKPSFSKLSFSVFPDPGNKTLHISIQNYQEGRFYEIELVSASGQSVYLKPFSGSQGTIDVSSLTAGSYFVNLRINKNIYSSRKTHIPK